MSSYTYWVDSDGSGFYQTIEGNPVERSKDDYPYNYSRYCIYNNGWASTDKLVYSDRLKTMFDDYADVRNEYLGRNDSFVSYEPEQIEKFLSKLFNQPVKLTGVEEECNVSNGYPYWLLYYRYV